MIENFKKLLFRYHQFGGFRLVRQYYRLGIAGFVFRQILNCAIERKPFKTIYSSIGRKIDAYLEGKYSQLLDELVQQIPDDLPNSPEENRNVIWFCWFQGLETAPDIVKACYNSLKSFLPNRDIKLITQENYSQYISFPQDIEQKWKDRIIPHAMFSDYLRLELLIRYGGTWIDSTVLCTGENYPRNILESDLFMFQYSYKGQFSGISSWFISSRSNCKPLIVLREMLYQYWRDFDSVIEYFIFHRFFFMIVKHRPSLLASMPKMYSLPCLQMDKMMAQTFNGDRFEKLTNSSAFHKLNYRVSKKVIENKDNYYNHLIDLFNR